MEGLDFLTVRFPLLFSTDNRSQSPDYTAGGAARTKGKWCSYDAEWAENGERIQKETSSNAKGTWRGMYSKCTRIPVELCFVSAVVFVWDTHTFILNNMTRVAAVDIYLSGSQLVTSQL